MPAMSQAPPASRRTTEGQGRGFPVFLASTVAVLAAGAALCGLLLDDIYTGAGSTAQMFRGYDLVTAILIAPALVMAVARARRGSLVGHLAAAALLAALVYTYAFYIFGSGFNDLFLLHLGVFSTALAALVLALARIDVEAAAQLAARARVWPAAAALALLAVSLGGMWVAAAVTNAVDGAVPAGSALVETVGTVHLSVVLDLGVQVPLYAAAAVLVWRRTGWGYVLAFVALASGIPVQFAYLVAMPFQAVAGVPGAVTFDPFEPVILAVYVAGLASLLWTLRPAAHRDLE